MMRTVNSNTTFDTNSVLQAATRLLSMNKGLRRLVWACDVCGMIYLNSVPGACESCGARHSLSLQEDVNPEIHPRA